MKTKGMAHQVVGLERMDGKRNFAMLCEQGTGKTWMLLADAERAFLEGKIDCLLVAAPRGVHTNWVRREIPTHLSCPVLAVAWNTNAGKKETKKMEEVLNKEDRRLRVFSINIDAVNFARGWDFAERFILSGRTMIVLDESSRIKSPDAARTKALLELRSYAVAARIASGTPITNAPVDIFAQFEFLRSGLLGTTSYRAFVAEYADLLDPAGYEMKKMVEANPRMKFAQIVAKNPDGSRRWKNLDKLQGLIAPHAYRVLKRDCLDLPEKIYKTHYFDMSAKQRAAYDKMRDELRIQVREVDQLLDGELAADEEIPVSALAAIVKLQQITSGFVKLPDGGEVHYVAEDNPRLDALVDLLEDVDGKFIVWARFREEIEQIATRLRAAGIECVEYHGGVKTADREAAVDAIQLGTARGFIGQAQSGGIGLTLTEAATTVYYSNDFNAETRWQSEDRNHRIGTKSHVVYIDLAATDSIDERIAESLRRKKNLAAGVLGDARPAKSVNNQASTNGES